MKSLFYGTGSVPVDVGHLPLLARLSGLFLMTCVIQMFLRTVTGSHWRRFYLRSTSVFSALEVFFTRMRYMNLHLTLTLVFWSLHSCTVQFICETCDRNERWACLFINDWDCVNGCRTTSWLPTSPLNAPTHRRLTLSVQCSTGRTKTCTPSCLKWRHSWRRGRKPPCRRWRARLQTSRNSWMLRRGNTICHCKTRILYYMLNPLTSTIAIWVQL